MTVMSARRDHVKDSQSSMFGHALVAFGLASTSALALPTSIQVKSQLGNPAVKAAVTSLLDAANTIGPRTTSYTQSWVSRTLAGEMRSETTDPLDWVQTCTRSGHTRIFSLAHTNAHSQHSVASFSRVGLDIEGCVVEDESPQIFTDRDLLAETMKQVHSAAWSIDKFDA